MFRAEIAEILLFPVTKGGTATRTTLGPGEHVELMVPEQIHPHEGVWARVASEREALLLAHPIKNERLREFFEKRSINDAMVAPLQGKSGVFGTMLVGNRMGTVSTFDREDLHLFETLANHASVSLENARLVARLEESLAHLTEMNQLKDDFVSSVSHELRTPLTSIQGYVKTLLRPDVEFLPEQKTQFLETINRQSERLRQLIEDLLVVARLESKREAPVVTTMSLRHLALQVIDELRSRGSSHTLHLRLGEDLPPIRTDSGKVHQIISNLVDNAIKYTPERTRITIAGRLSRDGIIVSVEDEGPGISVDKQGQIFDRFFQVDQSSTRSVGGTGLGLYICRKLADSIGAQVWLERSDPSGSVFSVSLPWELSEVPIDLTDDHAPADATQGSLMIIEGGAETAIG
jgi:signal transduction histidine kinase